MLKIKDKVADLLEKFPHLRDDDNKLIATIWRKEFGMDNVSALAFLIALSEGTLTSAENIRRSRQKLQEQRPELRGLNYNKRQRKGVETKHTIKHL